MTTPRQWHPRGVVVVVVMMMMMMTTSMTMETEGQRLQEKRTEIARLEKRLLQMLQDRALQQRQEVRGRGEEDYSSEEVGRRWMEVTNRQILSWKHREALAEWNFFTNITPRTQSQFTAVSSEFSKWNAARRKEGRKFKVQLFDPDLQRQFWIFNFSSDPHDPDKLNETMHLKTTMTSVYAEAKVCLNKNKHHQHHHHHQPLPQQQTNKSQCLSLEPDLTAKMAESRDPEELKALWEGWRDVAGKPQRERYAKFVQLLNQGARDNGFRDYSQYWEQDQFLDNSTNVSALLHELWSELRPLYLELHAYVRGKLRQRYGSAVMGNDGTIPAHLLGNMWAQNWDNIFDLVAPFPKLLHPSNNANKLLQNKVTTQGLFQLSDSFYRSMGLPPMTPTFWNKSMLVKPVGREVQCHASAFDLFSPGDFRIKMCSSVTMEYLRTVHHEMGHVQYFMAYAPQPALYRGSANQGFHEAIGDTAALSVMSKTHLEKLGLASYQGSHGETVNQLLQMALAKIAFLPFSLVVDWWRWQVFQGKTLPADYNHDWWKLRLDLQGIRSPVPRSEDDFDPAAKMHIVGNSPYLCYFVSFVVQFQFYEALCKTSGHTGPLYLCDFAHSTTAGDRFHKFMALGASQPWQKALKKLTGSDKISTKSILEYFSPLRKWLQDHNAKTGEKLGWSGASVNWLHSV